MNFWPRNYRAILGATVITCFVSPPSAKSCGDFRKPETHFDGVNEYGFVSYWDHLGEIKLADGNVLPLIMGFRSDWETLSPSPHLGSGWLLGLLDSYFVQRSENAFDMISIDGYTVPFGRDPKNPSILNGAQGWKAEIKGDVVTVWAECGWKLQFTKGKISSITTPKNSVVQIRRDQDGLVSDVIEGTTVLLKVQKDSKGKAVGLTMGKEHIGLDQVEKPLIQTINGVNVIGAKNSAVGRITLTNGITKVFDYTPGDNLHPAMTLSGARLETRTITWNAASKLIASDGSWRYNITPAVQLGINAAIERINSKNGQSEFWHYDTNKGQEISTNATGKKVIKSKFVSGKFSGKLRKIQEDDHETYFASYDQEGRLLRERKDSRLTEYQYSDFGLSSIATEDKKVKFEPRGDGLTLITVEKHGRQLSCLIDKNGNPVQSVKN